MHPDPHAVLRDRVLARVLDGPGASDPTLRHAAADRANLPADLQALVDTMDRHAYRVTDEQIAALRATHDDEELFEVVVSAALGAARRRLHAGLAALEEA